MEFGKRHVTTDTTVNGLLSLLLTPRASMQQQATGSRQLVTDLPPGNDGETGVIDFGIYLWMYSVTLPGHFPEIVVLLYDSFKNNFRNMKF